MTEIEKKIRETVVEVLGVDESDVNLESNLVDDLAAESIDFVDITYNMEQAFGLKINPGDIFPAFLREVTVFGTDGSVTPEVLARLEKEYSHITKEQIEKFKSQKTPTTFFEVGTLIRFVEKKKL